MTGGGGGDNLFDAAPAYRDALADAGLTDPARVFDDPRIVPWRSITERENCTLDLPDGRRLHVKRFHACPGRAASPAADEARGIRMLEAHAIPTAPLVAWGRLADRRSFVITADLAGYRAADKWVDGGGAFDRISDDTAKMAAKLHAAGLHHRDLYLCHYFVRPHDLDLRLIDAARVRELPPWPLRRRWIVKDLAQFWYSTIQLRIDDAARARWLATYADARRLPRHAALARSVARKAARIARHDAKLRAVQPHRNISIPGA